MSSTINGTNTLSKALVEVASYISENKLSAIEGIVDANGVKFQYRFVKLKKGIDYDKEEEE